MKLILKIKNSLIPFILLLISWQSLAQKTIEISQVNRYFIYFTDKNSETYPYTISNPERYLSPRAIERRRKQNIPILEEDLPAAPVYIQGLKALGVDVYFVSKWFNGVLATIDTMLLDEIKLLPYVDSIAWIANNTVLSHTQKTLTIPTEFSEPKLVDGTSDIQLMMLNADLMHIEDIQGQGMLIAILDNGYIGVDKFTPFQKLWKNNQIIATKDFVQNSGNVYQHGSHGTSVFSIISSDYRSENGNLIGIAPKATFILCVTEEGRSENRVEEYNWLLAAEFVDSLGADVINSSLGYRTFDILDHNYSFEDLDGETTVVSRAANMAANKGIIVVTSAGNNGGDSWGRITAPADAKGILTVGSVNMDCSYSSFSSVGPTSDGRLKPDVAALGYGTAVVQGDGIITRGSGTSFSSPLIAGFAAGIWQANPDWTSQQVIQAIKDSGSIADAPDSLRGYGVPIYKERNDTTLDIQRILDDEIIVYPNPFREKKLYLKTAKNFNEKIIIKIIDPKGSLIFEKLYTKKEVKENIELAINRSIKGIYFLFLQTENKQKIVKLINF